MNKRIIEINNELLDEAIEALEETLDAAFYLFQMRENAAHRDSWSVNTKREYAAERLGFVDTHSPVNTLQKLRKARDEQS
jgi:hypothetical protein